LAIFFLTSMKEPAASEFLTKYLSEILAG